MLVAALFFGRSFDIFIEIKTLSIRENVSEGSHSSVREKEKKPLAVFFSANVFSLSG